MSRKPHILLSNDFTKEVDFSPFGRRDDKFPERDVASHAAKLREEYNRSLQEANSRLQELEEDGLSPADGVYFNFKIDSSLSTDSLMKKKGPRLMSVKDDGNGYSQATLYLQKSNTTWLTKKLDKYEHSNIDSKHINCIEEIKVAKIRDFLTQKEDIAKFDSFPSDFQFLLEIWIYKDESIPYDEDNIIVRLDQLGIQVKSKFIEFSTGTVVLVKTDKRALEKLPETIDLLAELRLYRDASVLLNPSSLKEERVWIDILESELNPVDNPVIVALHDAGIKVGHKLLDPFIPQEYHRYAATDNPVDRTRGQHGVLMSGLILHGDVTEWLSNPDKHQTIAKLLSVKIYPGDNEDVTDPTFYGAVFENAMIHSRQLGVKINCSAVTRKDENDGTPSSWSSAIDEVLYNQGEASDILILAAGNVEETKSLPYPDFNIATSPKDPAQAWNAIAVGAVTNKCVIHDPSYLGQTPLAGPGQISPYTPCSNTWKIIKPDIVMEGGNALDRGGRISAVPDELNMVSTYISDHKKFDAMYATSGASALAANFASHLQYEHPDLSALTIRALMIHSADWTDELKNQFTFKGELDKSLLLHTCGYGVPDYDKAVASSESSATFILEREFQPFSIDTHGYLKADKMDLIEIPWPKELLLSLEDTQVRIKVTLSFYIQPWPGKNSYKYESHSLRFDLINPTEKPEEFQRRVSHIEAEGAGKSSNKASRWGIGITNRDKGSVISDYIETTASELATCNLLAVYPKYGWWRKRKWIQDEPPVIKYSLVVTLETPEKDVYPEITNKISQPITIGTR